MLRLYPWFRPGWAALIWCAVPALMSLAGLFSPLWMAAAVLSAPFVAAVAGGRGGLTSLIAGAALPLAALVKWQLPAGLLAAAAAYALIPAVSGAALFIRRVPFWKAMAVQLGAFTLVLALAVLLIRPLYGPDLFQAAGRGAAAFISAQEESDMLLIQLNQLGLCTASLSDLGLPVPWVSFGQTVKLLPAVKAELLASLTTTVESLAYWKGPGLLVNWVLAGGLVTLCAPVCFHKRRGWDTLDMPVFARWRLPRGMGAQAGSLAAGYLLPYLSYSPALVILGNMMSAAFFGIFMVQGAATLEYLQKKKGASWGTRRVWICVLGLILPFVLVLMGVWDQLANMRGLGAPKNREEE